MLTLYGDFDSGNVYKVRLLLAQLGIAYRRVDTTQNRGETASAKFRAINPIGKIPTIVFDDGRMLSESGAILYFLARDTALFPADAWDQANVLRWMFFEQYSHEPYIAVNRHWKLHLPPAEQSRLADRIAQNHTRGEQALAVMEQRLRNSAWLAAGCYTIADIALYAYTHTANDGGFELGPYSGIRAWLNRVRAQPGHIPQMQQEQDVPVVKWGDPLGRARHPQGPRENNKTEHPDASSGDGMIITKPGIGRERYYIDAAATDVSPGTSSGFN